jgi:PAS domain S-box-containing protein
MKFDGLIGAAVLAYAVVLFLWAYTLAVSFVRMRGTRATSPMVSRLYLVLVVGSTCAMAACANDIARLVFSTGALGGAQIEAGPLIASMILPFCTNAMALAVALAVVARGWLGQIECDGQGHALRQQALEELVDQRTAELSETVERLEQDRCEREQIELQSRAEHAMLDAVMKTSVGAICVVNADGQIVFANGSAQSVLGVSVDETTRRTYNAAEWQHTDLEGRPLPENQMPFRRVIVAGEPIQNMQHGIAWPDGTRRILEINGAPLFGVDGAISGVVFLVTDITQRKAIEKSLGDSEQRFRLMVEDLPTGAVFVEGDRIFMNRAAERITGYSRTELATVSQWFWALYGEASAEARAKYEEIRDAGFLEVCEGTIRRQDGELRTIECGGYQSNNATVWLLHDNTQAERSNDAGRRASG